MHIILIVIYEIINYIQSYIFEVDPELYYLKNIGLIEQWNC
jgi:hypothetical protein